MSSMIHNILIFLLIVSNICCQSQNFLEDQNQESSDNKIKIDVKQKYNVTLEGINAAHNVVAASFFPAQVSSIQLARDIEFSIFAEAERLV